jgi:tetratricopeptide (TPR) repeat protein
VGLGQLATEEGNLDQAQAYLEEALATARELELYEYMMYRLAILGNILYLQGNIERAKQNFMEGIHLAKGRGIFPKANFLVLMLHSIYLEKPENSARIIGVIDNSRREMEDPMDPLFKRNYYDRAEAHARTVLGDVAFESAFAEGQKMSVDEALDLVLMAVEEM